MLLGCLPTSVSWGAGEFDAEIPVVDTDMVEVRGLENRPLFVERLDAEVVTLER